MYLRGGERRFFTDREGMHGAGRQIGLVAIGPVNPDGLLGRPALGCRFNFDRGVLGKGRSQPAQWNGEILKQSCVLMIHGPKHVGLLHNPLGENHFLDAIRGCKFLLVGELELCLEAFLGGGL